MPELDSTVVTVPPDALRITASYPTVSVGDQVVPGHPETIEVTINEQIADDPAELCAFIRALVDTLFRDPAHASHVHLDGAVLDAERIRGLSLVAERNVR